MIRHMTELIRTLGYVLILRCEEADRVRSLRSLGETGRAERIGEVLHSGLCGSCRRARRQVDRLDAQISRLRRSGPMDGPSLSPQDRRRILHRVEENFSH